VCICVYLSLDVTRSPDSILSQLSNHCLLSLVFCPQLTTLYALAGYVPENTSAASASVASESSGSGTPASVGTWVVDKVFMHSHDFIDSFLLMLVITALIDIV